MNFRFGGQRHMPDFCADRASARTRKAPERIRRTVTVKMGYDAFQGAPVNDVMAAGLLDGAEDYVERINPDAVIKFGVECVTEAIKAKIGEI
ncbi:hypothetical protein [Paracoccus sp. R86501]|uniref:hypothetical protein n=1 Tax=Paracoccus sp. R86501 TaxID=3101711 RepID=UPI00366F25EA